MLKSPTTKRKKISQNPLNKWLENIPNQRKKTVLVEKIPESGNTVHSRSGIQKNQDSSKIDRPMEFFWGGRRSKKKLSSEEEGNVQARI